MNLDEAIKHCEEVANANERLCETVHPAMQLSDYGKCAEEYRQLAEWLKELKAYKEQSGDAISRQAVLDIISNNEEPCDDRDGHYIDDSDIVVWEIEDLPSVTPQQRTGRWKRMSDLPNDVDDRFECSRCGNVVHHRNVMDLRTFNRWCGRCGSDNG